MRCFAQFGTICTIQKTRITFMEECYFQPATLLNSNTPPGVLFTFLKLYMRYRIGQRITYVSM